MSVPGMAAVFVTLAEMSSPDEARWSPDLLDDDKEETT